MQQVQQQKRLIRRRLKQQRQQLSCQEQRAQTARILAAISRQPCVRYARRLGIYLAQDNEPSLQGLLSAALKQGKICYAPVVKPRLKHENTLEFHRLPELSQGRPGWQTNIYGIVEPKPTRHSQAVIWTLDLVFVPLIAYDKHGKRLGRGGGYYDRTFTQQRSRPLICGVAYSFQQVPKLPAKSYDLSLDAIVTEQGWQEF